MSYITAYIHLVYAYTIVTHILYIYYRYKKYVKNEKVKEDQSHVTGDEVAQTLIKTNLNSNNKTQPSTRTLVSTSQSDSTFLPTKSLNPTPTSATATVVSTAAGTAQLEKSLLEAAVEAERQKQHLEKELDLTKRKAAQQATQGELIARKRLKENR